MRHAADKRPKYSVGEKIQLILSKITILSVGHTANTLLKHPVQGVPNIIVSEVAAGIGLK